MKLNSLVSFLSSAKRPLPRQQMITRTKIIWKENNKLNLRKRAKKINVDLHSNTNVRCWQVASNLIWILGSRKKIVRDLICYNCNFWFRLTIQQYFARYKWWFIINMIVITEFDCSDVFVCGLLVLNKKLSSDKEQLLLN